MRNGQKKSVKRAGIQKKSCNFALATDPVLYIRGAGKAGQCLRGGVLNKLTKHHKREHIEKIISENDQYKEKLDDGEKFKKHSIINNLINNLYSDSSELFADMNALDNRYEIMDSIENSKKGKEV